MGNISVITDFNKITIACTPWDYVNGDRIIRRIISPQDSVQEIDSRIREIEMNKLWYN